MQERDPVEGKKKKLVMVTGLIVSPPVLVQARDRVEESSRPSVAEVMLPFALEIPMPGIGTFPERSRAACRRPVFGLWPGALVGGG